MDYIPAMQGQAAKAVEESDNERGEAVSAVFVEVALASMSQILAGQTQVIQVLLDLMQGLPEMSCKP
jgi:type II secretory pathway component HofQ